MNDAEKIIAKLIDEKKITGDEAVILLNACKTPQLFIPESKPFNLWDPSKMPCNDSYFSSSITGNHTYGSQNFK